MCQRMYIAVLSNESQFPRLLLNSHRERHFLWSSLPGAGGKRWEIAAGMGQEENEQKAKDL